MSRHLRGTDSKDSAPSVERLRELFECRDGGLYRVVSMGSRAPAGARAGSLMQNGYENVGVDGQKFLVHRIVWAITHGSWPPMLIDHINSVKTDNRPENLRSASDSQNSAYSKVSKNNRLGMKGVKRVRSGRYVAQMGVGGKVLHLGTFDSAEEAQEAFRKKSVETHGEFSKID